MKNTGWLVLLLLVLLAETDTTSWYRRSGWTRARCSSSCSPECTCLWGCDCRSKGLTSVPQDLPTNFTALRLWNNSITTLNQSDFSRYSLTELRLHHNQISVINSGAFYNLSSLTRLYLSDNQLTILRPDMFVGLESLRTLDLGYNNIHSIEAGTFNATPQLQTLILQYNQLTILRSDMFVGLDNLGRLYLHNNSIHSIEAGTFSNTGRLYQLELQNNNIVTIGPDTLPNSSAIRYIYLSNNDINAFPVEALITADFWRLKLDNNQMETLPSAAYDVLEVGTVNIDGNPWQCDCRMLPFKRRLTGFPDFEKTIRCEGPEHLQGKGLLLAVEPEDLVCEEEETSTGPGGGTGSTVSGGGDTDSAPSPGFYLSVFLSGFLGVVVGTLLASAAFLTILCKSQPPQNQPYPSPCPQPDTHVTTKAGHDVTGTGTAV